jgi:MFS family permease
MNGQIKFISSVCIAEILTMAGTMFFPALLPGFQSEWHLSNTEAGWINGIFFGGYAAFSPILVSLTDRIDPRRIYLLSAFLGALSMLGFGLLAQGTITAMIFRFCAGISLAGTFMPGLKALSDRITGKNQSRAIAFYTSSYGIGTAASVFFSGLLATWLHWRQAATVLSFGYLGAILIFSLAAVPKAPVSTAREHPVLPVSIQNVLQNRSAIGYIFGYAVHCWELFGFRSWMVAFLAFSLTFQGENSGHLSPQNIATLIVLAGVPASILGNEIAHGWNRRRAIAAFMLASGIFGCFLGFCAHLPYTVVAGLCIFYGIAVMLDSGSLTAGVVAAARDEERGRTLALYTFAGFCMAFFSPLVFGFILDMTGGGIFGWGAACASLGAASMTGPLWLNLFRNKDQKASDTA